MASAVATTRGVAVVQLRSSLDKLANLQCASQLVAEAKRQSASLVCLPECFDFMTRPGRAPFSSDLAEPLDGPTMTAYRALAKEHRVWLSLGGFHERLGASDVIGDSGAGSGAGSGADSASEKSKDSGKIANTHVVVSADGEMVATYRKIHLFDVGSGVDGGYRESSSTLAGDDVVVVHDTPVGTLGLSTCYDVRFPGLYAVLRDQGADVLLVPSAFMPSTGKAHWETLLRARAIETQCYVVAAAQSGVHNDDLDALDDDGDGTRSDGAIGDGTRSGGGGAPRRRERESYGHSLVVDPWGEVLCDLGTVAQGVATIDVDHGRIAAVRRQMPVQAHRHTSQATLRAAAAAPPSS